MLGYRASAFCFKKYLDTLVDSASSDLNFEVKSYFAAKSWYLILKNLFAKNEEIVAFRA